MFKKRNEKVYQKYIYLNFKNVTLIRRQPPLNLPLDVSLRRRFMHVLKLLWI